jgi:hypothetical protein
MSQVIYRGEIDNVKRKGYAIMLNGDYNTILSCKEALRERAKEEMPCTLVIRRYQEGFKPTIVYEYELRDVFELQLCE